MKVSLIRTIIGIMISILVVFSGLYILADILSDEEEYNGPPDAPDHNSGPQMMVSTRVNNETKEVHFKFHRFNIKYPNRVQYYLNSSWKDETIVLDRPDHNVKFDELGNISIEFWLRDGDGTCSEKRNLSLDLSRHTNMHPIPMSTDRSLHYGYIQQPVLLNGEGSYDPDGEVIGYYWDFGDGQHSNVSRGIKGYMPSKVVAHTYEKTGLYEAKLYVMDNEGNISEHPYKIGVIIHAS